MRRTIAVLLIAATACLCTVGIAAEGEDQAAKNADIRRLMEVSGELEATRNSMLVVLDHLKNSGAKLPDAYWDEFKKALMTDSLPSQLVAVYDRHYEHAEILSLIEFYKSDIGQILSQKLPLVQADLLGTGQNWAATTSSEIMSRLMPMRDDAKTVTPSE